MINDGMLKCDRCGKEIGFCDNFRPVSRSDNGAGRILCMKCYDKFQKQIKKFYDGFFTSYTKREKGK